MFVSMIILAVMNMYLPQTFFAEVNKYFITTIKIKVKL